MSTADNKQAPNTDMDVDNNQVDNTNDKQPLFNEEQQKKVDALIQSAMGRAGKAYRQEAETLRATVEELKAKLNELSNGKKQGNSPSTTDDNEEPKVVITSLKSQVNDLLKALQTEREEKAALGRTVLDTQKSSNIQRAAGAIRFVNLDQVIKLTQDSVLYDEDEKSFYVVNEKGQPKLNENLERMSLSEFYAWYAKQNPHLVAADARAGAGSTPATNGKQPKYKLEEIFGKDSDTKKANDLARSNPAEYASLRKEAVARGLLKV